MEVVAMAIVFGLNNLHENLIHENVLAIIDYGKT